MDHERIVKELCFVCGFRHSGTVYEVTKFQDNLKKAFSFDFSIVTGVTPEYFCNTCYRTVTMYEAQTEKGLLYDTRKRPKEWKGHTPPDCDECYDYHRLSKAGRKKKVKKGRGKSVGLWTEAAIPASETNGFAFMKDLDKAKLKFINPQFVDCLCVMCCEIVDRPLVFKECSHCCCRCCFVNKFFKSPVDQTCCPSCNVVSGVVSSQLLLSSVRSLRTPCFKCDVLVVFEKFESHIARCEGKTNIGIDVGQYLRKMFNQSTSGIVEIPGGGQPLCVAQLSKPRLDATIASASTLRKRSQDVEKIITFQGGSLDGGEFMKETLIKRMRKEERERILSKLNILKPMTEAEGLSMLADLNMTWYTYRAWGRWMRNFGFKNPSEKKMRITMETWLCDRNVKSEFTPFHGMNGKDPVMISAPMAYVTNFKDFVISNLDMLAKEGLFVDYPFMKNEVHVKFGGDHGLGSYKQSFQICNVENPNSVRNTTVVNVFEAKDTKPNLKTALLQYSDDIKALQRETWRVTEEIEMFEKYENGVVCLFHDA